jgi:hypothetical protein
MMILRSRRCSNLAKIACIIATAGCSFGTGDRGDVRGSVTLDGKPLALGAITLEPAAGGRGQVTGGLIQKGRYELRGKAAATIGSYRVLITASPTPTGRMIQEPTKPPGSLSPEMIGGVVAERYNAATTLTIVVAPGDNVADFAVESK